MKGETDKASVEFLGEEEIKKLEIFIKASHNLQRLL